jgi:PAS domain S-box-containing protein
MTGSSTSSSGAAAFLAGGGEMGALIRATDWSTTPLGPIDNWSPTLRMMVSFLLANRFPLLLWWGPQYIQIYNDAYRPIPGAKHPKSLGQPAGECWREIWHIIGPLIDTPFGGGPATWMEDLELEIQRSGFIEETHFTVAYSPVPDDTAPRGIGGVLATVHEITEKVIGERRVVALRDLGARAAEAKRAEEACAIAAAALANHPKDIPFALLYLLDADGSQARLAGAAGVSPGEAAAPLRVSLDNSAPGGPWPLAKAMRRGHEVLVKDLASRIGRVPAGPWSDPPRAAVIVPVRSNKATELAGLLVAGISPRLRLDSLYRSFLDLVATQIAAAVSNARAYEDERRRAEALAEIDRAKTAFFSNVSHEFRTPLTLMLGPLEDALAVPAEELPKRREDLALVHRSSLRLLRLVNTLLDFSRIEAGRVEASYEPVDLAAHTLELASVFRSATERAGLQLTLDCPPLPEPAWVDRSMWEKIVLNLLSNAFKFTFEGRITVRLRQQARSAVLEVEDTGTGIPQHEIPRLFDRLYRVEGARGRTHEGTGIGLALVQELAKLHGGTVRAASVLDEGSVFTVTVPLGRAHLPRDRLQAAPTLPTLGAQPYVEEALRWLPGAVNAEIEQEAAAKVSPVSGSEGERATVLVADDNADMRDYVRRLLAPRYEVRTAADGAAALAALREQPPDLLLSDVMMPRLDGFGLLREIRADPALADFPVILLSARAGEEASIEGLEAGADDYLIKPFSARELLARVRANLQMAQLRREAKHRFDADLQAMSRLREVGEQCIRAANEFQECLEAILDAAITITGAERGNIQLLDVASGALEIVAQRGFEQPFLDFFAKVEAGEAAACGTAMQSSERVIVEDVTQSHIFAGQPALNVLLEAGVRAVQSTPLISGPGNVFGMISTHFGEQHRPSERDLRLMDLLARQASDYLERNKAESAAQAIGAELKLVFDTSAAGLTHCSRNMRYVSANPAYAQLAGVPLEQIIGRPISEVMSEEAFDLIRPYVERVLQGERVEYEVELPWAGRGPAWNHVVYAPCRESDGTISGWVAWVSDISERKRAEMSLRELNERLEQRVEERARALEAEMAERQKIEAMLQQAQRLEAVGQLTGGVAHDFNNLLQVILANADMLQRRLGNADGGASPFIAAVQRAAERGARLTSQMLAFARSQQLEPVTLSIDRSILNIGELVRRAVGEAVTVEITPSPGLWSCRLDPARFESAILNLAVNARDAMPEGGELVIASRNVTLAKAGASRLDLAPGDYVRVSVTDTGTGMAPEVQRRAFEPFFTTKDVGKGTGLGLAQIYGFAKQSGGTATIDSAVGKGTTVALYLPRAEPELVDEEPAVSKQEVVAGHGKTILVVEDQPDVLAVIEVYLEDLDYRILTAANGPAARKLLESDEPIDLLLTDVVMPNGVDGFELAQEARRLRQDLKIIMMSGYIRDPQSREGALADVVFLEKPFRQTDLAAAIVSALGVSQTESNRAALRRWSSAAAAGRGA